MPAAAGVGYSHSAYKWYPDMDPAAGMLRLVVGLGTKAVDRTGEDYPRLSNLDRPAVTVLTTAAQKHKYSQRNVDVLDLQGNRLREIPLQALLPELPVWFRRTLMERDDEAEAALRQIGRRGEVWFISCQKLLENECFTGLMQKLLHCLQRVYGCPVDIEYTVNLDETGDFVVNLLQCRPLYQIREEERVNLDALSMQQVFFEIRDSSMGASGRRAIDVVVQIDPMLYYRYPYAKKYEVAAAVEAVNRYYANSGRHLLLMAPGRIGTSSPELGVPVTFRAISNFSVICEVSDDRAGYHPELSYGSHMFQDLVEAEILYGAIFNNEKTIRFRPGLFDGLCDLFPDICPEYPQLQNMIRVREVENLACYLDSARAICGIETPATPAEK